MKAHLRWQLKSRACVLHLGRVWVVSTGPWSPSADSTAAGPQCRRTGWTRPTPQTDAARLTRAICHCPKPSFSERRRNFEKIRGGNCFSYSSKLHPAVAAQPNACCPCMGLGFLQLQGLFALYFCFFLSFSGVFGFPRTCCPSPCRQTFSPRSQDMDMPFVSLASVTLWSPAPVAFPIYPKGGAASVPTGFSIYCLQAPCPPHGRSWKVRRWPRHAAMH